MEKEDCRVNRRGRPFSLSECQIEQARELRQSERAPVREIADYLGVSHMTVWRALKLAGGDGAHDA